MKKIIIAFVLFGMVFNSFALELSEFRKAKEESSVLELLEDTEEYERGYDWIIIPELDTEPRKIDLPNNDIYVERERETLNFFERLREKVRDMLESLN